MLDGDAPKLSESILDFTSDVEERFGISVESQRLETAKQFINGKEISDSFKRYLFCIEKSLEHKIREYGLLGKKEISRDRGLKLSDILNSKRIAINNALEVILEKLEAQTAAIFLIGKEGRLERFDLVGFDINGKKIDRDWYKDESYDVSRDSFVGSAAVPDDNSAFGTIRYTHNLIEESTLDFDSKEKYVDVCGELKSAISVPLIARRKPFENNKSKTIGVLRLINKINPESKKVDGRIFDRTEDVYWLSFLTQSLSDILSDFAWATQSHILNFFIYSLANPPKKKPDFLEKALDYLVNTPETIYKAAVLRVLNPQDNLLHVVSTKSFNGVQGIRDNSPVAMGRGMAGWVAQHKQPLILPRIRFNKELITVNDSEWVNWAWVKLNDFQAFACFPLFAHERFLGTISFYTQCEHDFYADIHEYFFIESAATLLALFINDCDIKLDLYINHTRKFITASNSSHQETNQYDECLVLQIERALINESFDFRTVKGIAKETNIREEIVYRVLESSYFSRKSLAKSRKGDILYAHRSKKISVREFIALSQQVLSKPFYI